MGDLALQVRPELLDGVGPGRVRGQVEELEAALLLTDELPDLLRMVGGGVVEDDVQVQLRVHF